MEVSGGVDLVDWPLLLIEIDHFFLSFGGKAKEQKKGGQKGEWGKEAIGGKMGGWKLGKAMRVGKLQNCTKGQSGGVEIMTIFEVFVLVKALKWKGINKSIWQQKKIGMDFVYSQM
jgi:hypothetical protein